MTTDVVRRFNRTWARHSGVLDDSFLGLGRPYAESRLLFELADDPVPVRDLRERLGLDSGYLSRLLRALESAGLATTGPDPTDGRRRLVHLTASGRRARRLLDDRSEELAAGLVAPLTERQRDRLAEALAAAELLLRAAAVRLHEVAAADPHARTALAAYVAELDRRFPDGFDPGPPDDRGTFLVAVSDGEPVGLVGVRLLPAQSEEAGVGVGELKRMWVHGDWRAAGLGSRLLREAEDLARRLGVRRLLLDTNGTLTEAIALYDRSGYKRVGRYNDNPYAEAFFAKDLGGSPDELTPR